MPDGVVQSFDSTSGRGSIVQSGHVYAAKTADLEPVARHPGAHVHFDIRREPDDPVRTLMSTPVAWVEPTVSLMELAATLATDAVGAVAVMSGDHFDGVVSERDVVRTLSRGGVLSDVWAADVMTGEPVYVDPDEPILTAAERMLDEGVRHLPVMSEGQVVGVLSVRDVLRVLADAWRREHTSKEA